MFHVDYDRPTNRLRIVVEGFWRPGDVARFAEHVAATVGVAEASRPDFDVCVESLAFPVQSMDVADLLAQVMRFGMAKTTGRAAIIVGSQLNRSQAERTLVHPRVQVFRTVDRAQEWLAAPTGR